jgi:hypothetical protein
MKSVILTLSEVEWEGPLSYEVVILNAVKDPCISSFILSVSSKIQTLIPPAPPEQL